MAPGTILLVDDEPGVLEVLSEALQARGHGVATAGDGGEALLAMSRGPIDVVVSDIRMPRMGGLELLQAIRGRGLDAAVVFLTGYGTVENAVECLRAGAADYLLKPFRIGQLAAKIERILAGRAIRKRILPAAGENLFERLRDAPDERSLLRSFLLCARETLTPVGVVLLPGRERTPVVWGAVLERDTSLAGRCRALADQVAASGAPERSDCVTHQVLAAPLCGGPGLRGGVAVVRSGPAGTGEALLTLSHLAVQAAAALECLRARRTVDSLSLEVVTSHVRAVEAKDVYTRGHSERVSAMAAALGRRMGLPAEEVEDLRIAGMLHDVGKIGVPDAVLNKPGPLTPEEAELMRRHPRLGRDILGRVSSLVRILPAVAHHHERWDGGGYPDGLAGEDIPLTARIVRDRKSVV